MHLPSSDPSLQDPKKESTKDQCRPLAKQNYIDLWEWGGGSSQVGLKKSRGFTGESQIKLGLHPVVLGTEPRQDAYVWQVL